MATMVAVLVAQALPVLVPFAHRFGHRKLWNGIVLTSIATAILMAVFSAKRPFDEMHQKRLFILHSENVCLLFSMIPNNSLIDISQITTQEQFLHIAGADGAPGFDLLVEDIAREFSTTAMLPKPLVMNDYNSDWDSLYPFSAFLSPYKVPLAVGERYVSPWTSEEGFSVSAINNFHDTEAGTRSLTLEVKHPGIVWSGAFVDFLIYETRSGLMTYPRSDCIRCSCIEMGTRR